MALKPYFIQTPVMLHYQHRVAPFGRPRIKACLPLPEAYRSLPRPSSPSGAKASIVRPYALDQKNLGPSATLSEHSRAGTRADMSQPSTTALIP